MNLNYPNGGLLPRIIKINAYVSYYYHWVFNFGSKTNSGLVIFCCISINEYSVRFVDRKSGSSVNYLLELCVAMCMIVGLVINWSRRYLWIKNLLVICVIFQVLFFVFWVFMNNQPRIDENGKLYQKLRD